MVKQTGKDIAQARYKWLLDQARIAGLIGVTKDTHLSGRISAKLVAAARQRAHVTSDTDRLELALSHLALKDDFAAQLLERKGAISPNVPLGF